MKYAALFIALMLITAPAQAQIKDSYYFMADDGVQSPEEVQEEAQYVFDTCDGNMYGKVYFDCSCIAGTFLQARDKYGSVAPQEEILNDIYYGKNARCANPVGIAGRSYEQCIESSKAMREYNKDNEEYCSCVGNRAAQRFSKHPVLSSNYINKIQAEALVACDNRDENGKPLPNGN